MFDNLFLYGLTFSLITLFGTPFKTSDFLIYISDQSSKFYLSAVSNVWKESKFSS